jgi:hypothetical protein
LAHNSLPASLKNLRQKKLLLSGGMLKHNVAHRSWPFLGRARQYNASFKEGMFAFAIA